jgi:hypothetical protein
MADVVLPYPSQLPQDYYAKNLPPTPGPAAPPEEALPTPPPEAAPVTPSLGGAYYGDTPPDNPANGWLWMTTKGIVYGYIDPGVWIQVGTNW